MKVKTQMNIFNTQNIAFQPTGENGQSATVKPGAINYQPVYLDSRFAHNTPWCLLPGCGQSIDLDPTRPDAIFCPFHEAEADNAWYGTLNLTGLFMAMKPIQSPNLEGGAAWTD